MSYPAARKVANRLATRLEEIASDQGLDKARITILGTDLNSLVQGFLIMDNHHQQLNELHAMMDEIMTTETINS